MVTAGKLGALSPPTSATGHLAAAHFRGRAKWGRPYTTRKRSKRQKVHPLGGFFCFSTKMPLNQTSPEGAGWDEELSNIDPQAVYHTAWGDFGNKKAGLRGNAKRFLPQRPWIIENKRQCMQCMGLSPFALSFPPAFWSSPKMPFNQTSPEGAGWDEELSNIGS